MKTLVVYYSYSGATKKLAIERARAEGDRTDLCEIEDVKRLSKPGTFFVGCPKALRMKPSPIKPLSTGLTAYKKIIVMTPIWAGHPVPPAIAVMEKLPKGKTVEVVTVSSSGKCSAHKKIEALVTSRGCALEKITDLKK